MRGSCGGNAAPQPALRAAGRQEPLRAAAAAIPAPGAAPSCPAPPGRAAVFALSSSAQAGGRGPGHNGGSVSRARAGSGGGAAGPGVPGGGRAGQAGPGPAVVTAPCSLLQLLLRCRRGRGNIRKYASGGVGAEKRVTKLCEGSVCVCHLNGGSVIITGWFSQFKQGELFLKAAALTLLLLENPDSHVGEAFICIFYLSETGLRAAPV